MLLRRVPWKILVAPGAGADLRHMDHALVLARRGLGNTWPNPAVGCVIVKDGRVVARAEEEAARQAAERRAEEAAADLGLTITEPCKSGEEDED